MHILLNAIFNDLLPSVILKSELQMWFNEKKKNNKEKRDFTCWVIFISIFVKKKGI